MARGTKLLITYDFLKMLISFHLFENMEENDRIKKELMNIVDRLDNHRLYTLSKASPDEKEKEEARQKYLDKKGIHPDYRW